MKLNMYTLKGTKKVRQAPPSLLYGSLSTPPPPPPGCEDQVKMCRLYEVVDGKQTNIDFVSPSTNFVVVLSLRLYLTAQK